MGTYAWKWHLFGKGWLDFRHFKAFLTPVFFNFATWHCRPQSPTALAMLLPPRDRCPNMRYPLEAKCLKRMHLGKDQMTYRVTLFILFISFSCVALRVRPCFLPLPKIPQSLAFPFRYFAESHCQGRGDMLCRVSKAVCEAVEWSYSSCTT